MTISPQIFLAIQLLSSFANCAPTVSFPFNSQLPPVARIGSLYTYSFSPYTFRSDSNITYALGKHPAWLSFDGEERRLYGVPEDEDLPPGEVVGQPFQIIATDDTGSVTMDSTIVTSRSQGPSVKIPISKQIQKFGDYSAPSSILSYPAKDFSYPFDRETFEHKPGMINYYASSGDNSPLPAWITFNSDTMTFSGRTPAVEALYQPPQSFDVRLVASDIEGFSSTSIYFSIVVGGHKLTTENPMVKLDASRGSPLVYEGLNDAIKLDDKLVKPGDLSAITISLPGWLSLDPKIWTLKGTPGVNDRSSNFTINFNDAFSDTLAVLFMISIGTALFNTTPEDIEATPGESFSLDLTGYFKDPKDINVDISLKNNEDWLSLDGLKLRGKVPEAAKGTTNLMIRARSRTSGAEEKESIKITYLAADGTTTSLPLSTSTANSAGESGEVNNSEGLTNEDMDVEESHQGLSTTMILLATLIPILAVVVIIMATVCFIKRRRNRRYTGGRRKRTKISQPLVGSLRINGSRYPGEISGSSDDIGVEELGVPKMAYLRASSTRSSASSDTLGSLSTGEAVHEYRTHDAGSSYNNHNNNRAFANAGTEEGRQSWFTVQRTDATSQSMMSSQSRGSEITVPRSTHQLLPTPPFLSQSEENSFRSGLELVIPSLDTLPAIQLGPGMTERQRIYSTITSSSAALPSPRINGPTFATAVSVASASASVISGSRSKKSNATSEKNWSTIRESDSDGQVSEPPATTASLTQPEQQTIEQAGEQSNQQSEQQPPQPYQETEKAYSAHDSWSGIMSIGTETSFGSTENWRIIKNSKRGSIATIYQDLIKNVPFIPSHASLNNLSPGRDELRRIATMGGLNGKENSKVSLLRREDSAKASDGSFMAFI